jgi:hypothetical protein
MDRRSFRSLICMRAFVRGSIDSRTLRTFAVSSGRYAASSPPIPGLKHLYASHRQLDMAYRPHGDRGIVE